MVRGHYGRNPNFKRAGRRIIIPEFLGPLVIIFLSGLFVVIWGVLFDKSEEDLLILLESSSLQIILPCIVSFFSLIDFIFAFFLLIGIQQLNSKITVIWILIQFLLITAFYLSLYLCPFISLNIVCDIGTLSWVSGASVLILIYKIYRIRIIYFLIDEIQQEGEIWVGRSKVYAFYNYD